MRKKIVRTIFFIIIITFIVSACASGSGGSDGNPTPTPSGYGSSVGNAGPSSPMVDPSWPSYNYGYGAYRVTAVPTFNAEERKNDPGIIDYNYHPPKLMSSELSLYELMTTTGASKVYDATNWWQQVAAFVGYKPWGDSYKNYTTMAYSGFIKRPREMQLGLKTYVGIAPDIENYNSYFVVMEGGGMQSFVPGRRIDGKSAVFLDMNIKLDESKWRGGAIFINKNASAAFLAFTPGTNNLVLYYQNPDNRTQWLHTGVPCGGGQINEAKFYANVSYNVVAVQSGTSIEVCRAKEGVSNWERIMNFPSTAQTFGVDVNGDTVALSYTASEGSVNIGVKKGDEGTRHYTVVGADGAGAVGATEIMMSYDNKYALVLFVYSKAFKGNKGGKTNAIGIVTYAIADLEDMLVFPNSPDNLVSFYTGANFKPVTRIFLAKNLLASPDILYVDALYFYDCPFSTTYTSLVGVDGYIANILAMAATPLDFSTVKNVGPLRGH